MLKINKTGVSTSKESIFGCSCRLWLLSWRRARVFARSCSLLSKYLPISWKQRKEQSHAQCHVTHRIRIFDKISEHVKVAKSVDIAVPEHAVTQCISSKHLFGPWKHVGDRGNTLGKLGNVLQACRACPDFESAGASLRSSN